MMGLYYLLDTGNYLIILTYKNIFINYVVSDINKVQEPRINQDNTDNKLS